MTEHQIYLVSKVIENLHSLTFILKGKIYQNQYRTHYNIPGEYINV